MPSIKKFKIDNLDKKEKFIEAAHIVLDQRLRQILKQIEKYFNDDSSVNLHTLRISFRRFRYVMEIFYECYEPKFFRRAYNYAQKMQDLIGEGRDLYTALLKYETHQV